MDITITPAGMKALETDFMRTYGVPSALLMEHAAHGVCDALKRHAPGGSVLFLCGPRNNGGDGYAAARLWAAQGGQALIWELAPSESGDAGMNRTLAMQAGISVVTVMESLPPLPACDAIVDALFGTGLSREVTGVAAALIDMVNASPIAVIAVDIPSGLDGLTGRIWGRAVYATETVTFHRIKQGLLMGAGADCTGRLTVQPILIPKSWGSSEGLHCMTPEDLRLIPPRPVQAHKGTMGRVVILAGSVGMAGAAAFCANASIKAGAGLTQVLCRGAVLPIVQSLAPGATCVTLAEKDGRLTSHAARQAAHALISADAGAVGCGLGQDEDLLPLLSAFRQAACPVVWDADALNLLSLHRDLLPLPVHAVATPHPGEASRLIGDPPAETAHLDASPLAALRQLKDVCGCTVLLKGARTLMTDGSVTAVNRFGTPAMAKGGSGDVLTGILAALLARKLPISPLATIQLGVMIHGLAGLRAEELAGENGVTPQMLIDCIRLDR